MKFLDELKNVDGNIARYRSHLKSSRLSDARKKREADNLARYESLKRLYQDIFTSRMKL